MYYVCCTSHCLFFIFRSQYDLIKPLTLLFICRCQSCYRAYCFLRGEFIIRSFLQESNPWHLESRSVKLTTLSQKSPNYKAVNMWKTPVLKLRVPYSYLQSILCTYNVKQQPVVKYRSYLYILYLIIFNHHPLFLNLVICVRIRCWCFMIFKFF